MNPIEHPEIIMLIHNEKIRREIERNRRENSRGEYVPRPHRSDPGRFRQTISRGLIALARRIEPDAPADGIPAAARH